MKILLVLILAFHICPCFAQKNSLEKEAISITGNWYVEWHDYPQLGKVTKAALSISKQILNNRTQWLISGNYFDENSKQRPYSSKNIQVTDRGEIVINHPYYVLGHWGGGSHVQQVRADTVKGHWKYGNQGGLEVWQRSIPEITHIEFISDTSQKFVIGSLGQVELTYSSFWWGPRNDSRGNRPKFKIRFYGKNLWGNQTVSIQKDSGMEFLPGWTYALYENYRSSDRKHSEKMLGIETIIVVWQQAKPGRIKLLLNSIEIPFDFVVKGFPQVEEPARIIFEKKSEEDSWVETENTVISGDVVRIVAEYTKTPADKAKQATLLWKEKKKIVLLHQSTEDAKRFISESMTVSMPEIQEEKAPETMATEEDT